MALLSDPPVLILSGPPGAGKTTTAEALAIRFRRSVHVESDAFFRFVRNGHADPWRAEAHEQNTIVMRAVGKATAAYAGGGYLTILDGIVIPGWFLEPLASGLAEEGRRVAYAVLRLPLALCLERARERASEPLDDTTAIERLWQSFADLGPYEHHAIDVGEMTPIETAHTVAERLEADLLLT